MTNNDGWGKPWTPEELKAPKPAGTETELTRALKTIMAPGFPGGADPWPAEPSVTPVEVKGTVNFFHDDPPRAEYVEGPDAWPVNPADAGEPEPLTPEHYDHPECVVSPIETIAEGDGPFFVVYFGKINYCVLAGQYATQDEAQAAIPATWERFVADSAFDFIFPTRDPAGMEARTVRSVYNLKGAYGKV